MKKRSFLFCMFSASIVWGNPLKRYKTHGDIFLSESLNLVGDEKKQNTTELEKGPSRPLSQLSSEGILEWAKRGVGSVKNIQPSSIKVPLYKQIYLEMFLEEFQSKVFELSRDEIKVQKLKIGEKLKLIELKINKEDLKSSWVSWLLGDEIVEETTSDPLLRAVAIYASRLNSDRTVAFRDYLEMRYLLNSLPETRKYLPQLDSSLGQRMLNKLVAQSTDAWTNYYADLDDLKWKAQRSRVSLLWYENVLERKEFPAAEKIYSLYLADKVALNEQVAVGEIIQLVKLRVDLGQGEEALLALQRWSQMEPPSYAWYYYKARALENAYAKKTGEQREVYLSWAQENYRKALNEKGLYSDLRDELLEKYGNLLTKRNYLVEAANIWDSLFKSGLSRGSRLKGLNFRIHNLFDRAELSQEKMRESLYREGVSLAGFLANAGSSASDLKYIASRMRFIRRKLGLGNDAALEASIFEVEKLARKARNEN